MIAFFPITILLVIYSWWRLRFLFPKKYRNYGALLFGLCFVSFFFQRVFNNELASMAFQAVGSFTVVFLTNWLIICLLWDLFLGIRRLLKKSKQANKILRMRIEPILGGATITLAIIFLLLSLPWHFGFETRTVRVDLATSPKKPLKIAAFADIHFDPLFPKSKLKRLLDTLHVLQPDAVFFTGDLADISADILNARGLDSLFKQINPPLGFFASMGNHEVYMEKKRTIEWLRGMDNVIVLMDSTACNEFFCVSGRLDHQFERRLGTQRASLKELMPENDSIPWFILDHQPKGLDKQDTALSRFPDFAVSGHTHAGQFFPATIIIRFIWRLHYGLGNLDGVPWYVTSSIGQWMPIRVGSKTELAIFELL
ncbi:MAG: metallophosphoesterase [Fibromonadaceae bacterium]|jgi:predicted MPP superfamily phosphohydrolase|nr:metallophosphoesterase [Fibromonadaceae bacterium]